MAKAPKREPPGNFVSEWFGHRVYPAVRSSPESIADQRSERCPFLSTATGENRTCIKAEASKGVCTISTLANRARQDWLVCPYRALNKEIVVGAVRQLFQVSLAIDPYACPAITLTKQDVRDDILVRLNAGQHVFIYFDAKMSGELSIPPTDRSPEFAFDVTIVELTLEAGAAHIGRFGILEIQTMDFHGSYRAAVRNLRDGLRLHPTNFPTTLQSNQQWLCDGIEGPNIANVFKRTFYQMMFKFQLGQHGRCAGCVLAIPQAVWESWHRHLGGPLLTPEPDGSFSLLAPGQKRSATPPAWIYVFSPDAAAVVTPSPIVVSKMIATDVAAMSHWALDVAPMAALANIDSATGMLSLLARRLKGLWPELAQTVTI
jgi:Restriction endonuclease NotI